MAYSILSLLFFILFVGVYRFNWLWIISGYNTMTEEEKSKVDSSKLKTETSVFILFTAILLFICFVFDSFDMYYYVYASLIFFLSLSIVFSIKINKIIKSGFSDKSKKKRTFSLIFNILLFIFILLFISQIAKLNPVTFENNHINIPSIYGESISVDEIKNLSFKNDLVNTGVRSNGIATSKVRMGYFKNGNESFKLYLNRDSKSFIYFEYKNKNYIINSMSDDETQNLFNNILNAKNKKKND